MRKLLLIYILGLILSACSSEESINSKVQSEKQNLNKDVTQVEVIDQVFYQWIWDDNDIIGGIPRITSFAVIKNTGDTTVDVSKGKVTYLNENEEIIGLSEEDYTFVVPSIINPNDVAYLISTLSEPGDEYIELKDTLVDVTPVVVKSKPINLESRNVAIIKTDDFGGNIKVTGFLKNNEDTQVTNLEASAGVYDKDNNFLGAVVLKGADNTKIEPNTEYSIELNSPSFPIPAIENVDHADIQAISLN